MKTKEIYYISCISNDKIVVLKNGEYIDMTYDEIRNIVVNETGVVTFCGQELLDIIKEKIKV